MPSRARFLLRFGYKAATKYLDVPSDRAAAFLNLDRPAHMAYIDFNNDSVWSAFQKLDAQSAALGVAVPAINYHVDSVRTAFEKLDVRAATIEADRSRAFFTNPFFAMRMFSRA
jgi:hypothetical protein